MKRTYNFQVDQGLFVAEYYLKKDYKDITEDDLRENINMFSKKLHAYNKLSTFSSMTHTNSSLTQGTKDTQEQKLERIEKQFTDLMESIGDERYCTLCGEKKLQASIYPPSEADKSKSKKKAIPYAALLYGGASAGNYMNRGNNLKFVDVCPVCLYLSLLGFINTQKISYPFVYMSDSDEFMRESTEIIQKKLNSNTMLDVGTEDMAKSLIPEPTKTNQKKEKGGYKGLNYITIIQYANAPQKNLYTEIVLTKKSIDFINKVKYKGLLPEFYKHNLFTKLSDNRNLYNYITREGKVCSKSLYDMIKEEHMEKYEINIIEKIANRLVYEKGTKKAVTELKQVNSRQDMRRYLIKITEEMELGLELNELDKIIKKYNSYRDYIILEIQVNHKEREEK